MLFRSYRFDLEIEEDLIEEVARVHGFERIPAHPPRAPARMSALPEARRSLHAVRERLAASDYNEVINFSFVEPAWEADFAGRADPIRLLMAPSGVHKGTVAPIDLIQVNREGHVVMGHGKASAETALHL